MDSAAEQSLADCSQAASESDGQETTSSVDNNFASARSVSCSSRVCFESLLFSVCVNHVNHLIISASGQKWSSASEGHSQRVARAKLSRKKVEQS